MARALIGRTVRRLRTEQSPVATGAGRTPGDLGQLPEPDRARPARRHRLAADQAGRDAAGRSRRRCPAARSASLRSGCARRSPIRCWAPTRCRRRRWPSWPRSPERRARGAGAVSGLARGARGCRRHRAALRPPSAAAERGGARPVRRSRQPFPRSGGRGRGDRRRVWRALAGRDEPRHRRTAAPRAWR